MATSELVEGIYMSKSLKQELNNRIAKILGVKTFKENVKTFYHYKIIGDIAILKVSEDLYQYRKQIAKAILDIFKGKIRSIIYLEGIEGEKRQPKAEVLVGDKNTETIYREYGYMFKFDVLKLMLSLGNSQERKRMATISNHNEVILDMFAGIGQFTIPIAVHSKPKRIFSIDINPDAYYYLIENIFLNKVDNIVFPILGDSNIVVPRLFKENMFDRIIMGYFKGTLNFLPVALKVVKNNGIIHFHDIFPKNDPIRIAKEKVFEVIKGYNMTPIFEYANVVKSYSPKFDHVVLDIKVKKNN